MPMHRVKKLVNTICSRASTYWEIFLKISNREGVLTAIYKTLRFPFISLLRKGIFLSPSTEVRFTKIYRLNYWGGEESKSGFSSSLEATENLRQKLPELFDKFSIKSIFDAPCGDFNWMRPVVRNNNIKYIGADIVKHLIDDHIKYDKNERSNFLHFDITKHDFPKVDLWICRACLKHLSFEDTLKALQQFVNSDIPYILTSTHENTGEFENYDIATGDHRLIDLNSEPYFFTEDVLFRIDDCISPEPPQEMCLWSREQVEDAVVKFSKAIEPQTP